MGLIELKNFPLRNQLHDVPSADGKPAENAAYDCVPTTLAACIQWYTGKVVAADDLKDAVYGQGHIGGGAETTYDTYIEQHFGLHVGFEPLPSASQQIIDRIRYWLVRQVPVVITMHSQWSRPWASDAGDGLHVGTAFAIDTSDGGMLHIANPWRGFDHVQPISWWRDRLGIGVWPITKIGSAAPPLALPADWHDGIDPQTQLPTLLCANGEPIVKGFRAYVLAQLAAGAWQGGDALLPEWGDEHGTRQLFAATLLEWTPQTGVREGDKPDICALAAHLKQGKAA